MSASVISRHRPKGQSHASINAALISLRDEDAALKNLIEDETRQRASLLLTGSDLEIRTAENAIRDARLNLERIEVMTADLESKLKEARAIEAGEARAEQMRQANAATLKFNAWLAADYETHAHAIAEGIALENEARRQREALRHASGGIHEGLAEVSLAYVGLEARGFSFLVRLPAIMPGEPIVWLR